MEKRYTTKSQIRLSLMKGCEVQSLIYANCVYINNKGQVMDDGQVIDTLNTNDKISKIFEEFFFNEFGYNL